MPVLNIAFTGDEAQYVATLGRMETATAASSARLKSQFISAGGIKQGISRNVEDGLTHGQESALARMAGVPRGLSQIFRFGAEALAGAALIEGVRGMHSYFKSVEDTERAQQHFSNTAARSMRFTYDENQRARGSIQSVSDAYGKSVSEVAGVGSALVKSRVAASDFDEVLGAVYATARSEGREAKDVFTEVAESAKGLPEEMQGAAIKGAAAAAAAGAPKAKGGGFFRKWLTAIGESGGADTGFTKSDIDDLGKADEDRAKKKYDLAEAAEVVRKQEARGRQEELYHQSLSNEAERRGVQITLSDNEATIAANRSASDAVSIGRQQASVNQSEMATDPRHRFLALGKALDEQTSRDKAKLPEQIKLARERNKAAEEGVSIATRQAQVQATRSGMTMDDFLGTETGKPYAERIDSAEKAARESRQKIVDAKREAANAEKGIDAKSDAEKSALRTQQTLAEQEYGLRQTHLDNARADARIGTAQRTRRALIELDVQQARTPDEAAAGKAYLLRQESADAMSLLGQSQEKLADVRSKISSGTLAGDNLDNAKRMADELVAEVDSRAGAASVAAAAASYGGRNAQEDLGNIILSGKDPIMERNMAEYRAKIAMQLGAGYANSAGRENILEFKPKSDGGGGGTSISTQKVDVTGPATVNAATVVVQNATINGGGGSVPGNGVGGQVRPEHTGRDSWSD